MFGGLALLLAAAVAPNVLLTLPSLDRVVEGLATDGESIYVSRPFERKITVRKGATWLEWKVPDNSGFPLGMAWDRKRHWLWVTMDCLKIPGAPECAYSELVALDRKGVVVFRMPMPEGFHAGDVSADRGKVFVSDSRGGRLLRITNTLFRDEVISTGVGKSAQGSALTVDGKALIVADYSQGIARIDLKTWKRTLLPFMGKPLRGVDGLVRRGNTFYAIQNGGSVGRLLAFRVVGDTIEVEVIAEGDALSDPTQIAATRTGIIAVANSGWATIAEPGFVRRKGADILEFPLKPAP